MLFETGVASGLGMPPVQAAGKARVARNAVRHGLAIPLSALPELATAASRLTDLLAGANADAERRELARHVAEAEIDLIRVRKARLALLAKPMADPDYLQNKDLESRILAAAKDLSRRKSTCSTADLIASVHRRRTSSRSGEAERVNAIISNLAEELSGLDRYERRALSRRSSAVKRFHSLSLRAC